MESASKDVKFLLSAWNKGMYILVVTWFNIRAVCMVCNSTYSTYDPYGKVRKVRMGHK